MIGRQVKNLVKKNVRYAHISAAPQPQQSILGSLINPSKYPRTPLSEPFEGSFDGPAARASEGPAQVTTLENGLRVVSLDAAGPIANIKVFIDTGSRFEDASNHGINSLLQAAALKSTVNRSELRFFRENLMLGNQFQVNAGREFTEISATCLPEHSTHALGALGDLLAHPAFLRHEISTAKDAYREFICEEKERNPDSVEAIHAAAYFQNTLGNPLFALNHHLDALSIGALQDHVAKFWTADRIVIAATGVEHAALLESINTTMVDIAASAGPIQKVAATYTGGAARLTERSEDGLTHFTLGFGGPGSNSSDVSSVHVLEAALGGSAKAHVYSDSSLLTISGASAPEDASALGESIMKTALSLSDISEAQLAAAKAQIATAIQINAESAAYASSLGRQVLATGEVKPTADFVAAVEAVTTADVKRVAGAMLSSRLSSAATGEIAALPHQDTIESSFKSLSA